MERFKGMRARGEKMNESQGEKTQLRGILEELKGIEWKSHFCLHLWTPHLFKISLLAYDCVLFFTCVPFQIL